MCTQLLLSSYHWEELCEQWVQIILIVFCQSTRRTPLLTWSTTILKPEVCTPTWVSLHISCLPTRPPTCRPSALWRRPQTPKSSVDTPRLGPRTCPNMASTCRTVPPQATWHSTSTRTTPLTLSTPAVSLQLPHLTSRTSRGTHGCQSQKTNGEVWQPIGTACHGVQTAVHDDAADRPTHASRPWNSRRNSTSITT